MNWSSIWKSWFLLFLQSTHSTTCVCCRRSDWNFSSFAPVESWCWGERPTVINAADFFIAIIVFMKRSCVFASWIFLFFSVNALHWFSLLNLATLKFPVFCFNAKLMWRRRMTSNCFLSNFCYYNMYMFYQSKNCLCKFILLFFSVNTLHCINLLRMATLKLPVFCSSAKLMWGQKFTGNSPRPHTAIIVLIKQNIVRANLFICIS